MRWLIVVAGLLFAPVAVAQDQAAPPAKPLHRFPGLPELPTTGPARRTAGTYGQLFVSPAGEPFRAEPGTPYPMATWFAQADTDHDGKLDRTEFAADFDRFFDVLDGNHDGVIDPAEVRRYERELVPEVAASEGRGAITPGTGNGSPTRAAKRQAIAGGTGGAGQSGGDIQAPPPRRNEDIPIIGAGRYGLINIPEPVSAMDINLDGSVTRFEFRQAATRRFKLLDFDNRGVLRLEDLPRTPAQRSGEGNRRRRDR